MVLQEEAAARVAQRLEGQVPEHVVGDDHESRPPLDLGTRGAEQKIVQFCGRSLYVEIAPGESLPECRGALRESFPPDPERVDSERLGALC